MLFGKAELSINLDCHGRVQRFPRNDNCAFGAGIVNAGAVVIAEPKCQCHPERSVRIQSL